MEGREMSLGAVEEKKVVANASRAASSSVTGANGGRKT